MVLLLEQASAEQLGPLLRLGELWGSSKTAGYAQKLSDELLATIRNGSESDRRRIRSASELIALGRSSEPAVSLLVEQLNPQLPPAVASGIVRALAGSTAGNLAEQLIDLWPAATPTLRADILAVLLARPSGANSILDAIKSGAIAVGELSLDQRLSLSDHPDETIRSEARRLLTEFGGIVDADRQKVIDKFSSAAHQSGNPAKGKLLFVKNCANCHKHSGEGNEIGPDLTGMAVHPKEELLVHILDPSRSVEGNFRRYIILTADGQVLSGMLAAESLAAIELVDAEGKRKSINREDIDEIKSTNLSLMPAGFEEQMSLVDMTDLLEFLTSKGRFVPLPLAKVASKVSTKGMFSNSDNGPDRLIFRQWGMHEFNGIPFQLIDPQGDSRANALVLNAPHPGVTNMPKEVSIPCNMIVQSLHLLSGVSGWGFPYDSRKSTSMIVRFHYEDGTTEDHALINGEHFADYIRRVDVPGSEFAFDLRGQQLRYLSVKPKRNIAIASVDFVKGNDQTAPIVMAVTAERQE